MQPLLELHRSSSLSTQPKPISTQPYLLAKSPFCCPEICLPVLSSSLPLLPQFLQLPLLYLLSPSRLSAPHSFCFLILASVFFCSLCPLLASITGSLLEHLSFWGCHQLLSYTPPPPKFKFPKERIRLGELALIWIKLFKAARRSAALGSISNLLWSVKGWAM